MDSFSRAKLKSENQDLRSQIEELNRKLDIVNISLNKFINLSQKQDSHFKDLENKYDTLKMIMKEEIDQSFKFKQLIEFIKLKNNIIRISKLDQEDERYEMFISQYIQNIKNKDILKRIYPSACMESDYYKYYRDLKEIYNRIIHNS